MSQTFGSNQGQWQGVNSYNIDCKNNYIDTITARSLGSFVRAIGGKCNSHQVYGPYGGPETTNKYTRNHEMTCTNGFNGMEINSDLGIYTIAPICNNNKENIIGKPNLPIGNKRTFLCPEGQVIKNISGIYEPGENGYIGTMTLNCGLVNHEHEPFIGSFQESIGLRNRFILFLILLVLSVILIYLYMKKL